MNIKEVKTANKIGDFFLRKNHRNKIGIKYSPTLNKKILTDNAARIYLFAQDGIIKKIGGSAQKGGIVKTMSFYTGAMTGSPGVPRFVGHLLIERALKNSSKVELFMITSPRTLAKVSGLFGYKKVEIASFKEMEDFCKSDYFSREGKYPALKVGYRAKSIKKIDDYFARGLIDEKDLRAKDREAQRMELLKLYGVGPATVWYLLFDVFHHWDFFNHVSPWEQKIYSKLFFNRSPEKPVPVKKLLKYLERYGKYKHLAVHYIWEDLFWRRKNERIPWLEKEIRL